VEEMMKSTWLLAFIFITTMQISAKTIDKKIHKTFKVNEGASLHLKHGDGNVEITPWNKDVIDIKIVYRATFAGIHKLHPNDFEVEFEQRGDKISVIGREPRVIGIGRFKTIDYEYSIKAPAYVDLVTEGVDGNVLIEEWQSDIQSSIVDGDISILDAVADKIKAVTIDGDIELKYISATIECQTIDGRIHLEELENVQCRAKTVDGDIRIKNASGEFSARSVDGDIEMLRTSAIQLDAHTTDGKINLDLNNVDEMDCHIKSSDGDVRVYLEKGTSILLKLSTGDGHIRTDLSPVSDLQTDDNYFSGDINGGQGKLDIRTGDGDIELIEK
jgi:DUF4097 and DUF4098 domain-containing protein YvlB